MPQDGAKMLISCARKAQRVRMQAFSQSFMRQPHGSHVSNGVVAVQHEANILLNDKNKNHHRKRFGTATPT
jgi:hypothetical protein